MMPGPHKSIEERLMYAEHKLAMVGELLYNAAMAKDDDRVELSRGALIGLSESVGDVRELLRPIGALKSAVLSAKC
jgi:hypothetical protein